MTAANLAADLDARLRDPREDGHVFSHAHCAELDRREEFPAAMCAELDRLGVPRSYVPQRFGGDLASQDELVPLVRAIARRDLTVAVAHAKTYLGAACVWVAGQPAQARALAEQIAAGVPVSWALTERGHGSDLLAGEVTARPVPGGYVLNGEKWLINNATRGAVVCVLVRTEDAGGPRGFSLLLVDKRELLAGSYTCLPKVRTHGIRGADISGIAFHDALVPDSALVGTVGGGLEITLTALQLTRTACAALSLGAADHAIALAADFTAERVLYGRHLAELPHVRATLGRAVTALFVAEATAVVASRSAHTLPAELSVACAVTKSLVPSQVDRLISEVGELLGARAFLTDVHEHGAFQKLERDHRVVGIFDGNTFVNQNSLINQFSVLARGFRAGPANEAEVLAAATLDTPVPELDPARLRLVAREGSSVVRNLPVAVAALRASGEQDELAGLAEELLAECVTLHDELAAYRPGGRDVPAGAFDLARRYELCFAGASCLWVWLANPERWDAADPWPLACLGHVLDDLRPGRNTVNHALFDGPDRSFSLLSRGMP